MVGLLELFIALGPNRVNPSNQVRRKWYNGRSAKVVYDLGKK
jgi:hypothetical protein